jgi:RNA polymerase sigma-70 factor (ECF subfamily)
VETENTLITNTQLERRTVSSLPDKTLISLIAGGNEYALTELYQRYSQVLFRHLAYLVLEAPAAEDLLQETFVSVWKKAGSFQGRSSVKTWLLRISYHKAISWLRQQKFSIQLDDVETIPDRNLGLEGESILAADIRQVQSVVSELKPQQRMLLDLIFIDEFTYSEIAEIMNIPVGTVKSRVRATFRQVSGLMKRRNA